MPSTQAAAPAAGRPAASGNGQQPKTDWRGTIMRGLLMYFAMQAVTGPNGLIAWYRGRSDATSGITAGGGGDGATGGTPVANPASTRSRLSPPQQPSLPPALVQFPSGTLATPLFDPNAPLDFYIMITAGQAPTHADLATQQSRLVPGGIGARGDGLIQFDDRRIADLIDVHQTVPQQVWLLAGHSEDLLSAVRINNITLAESNLQRDVDLNIPVPAHVQTNNGSIWAEMAFVPSGQSPRTSAHLRSRKLLTRLFPERKERHEKRLFDKEDDEGEEEGAVKKEQGKGERARLALPFLDAAKPDPITWWHGNLTLKIVDQPSDTRLPLSSMPPPLLQHVHIAEDEEGKPVMPAEKAALNYPVVFPNDFWHLREHMHTINATHQTLPLHVSLSKTSFFKFQLLAAMSDSMDKQSMAANEMDMLKLTLMENSPWYLALTIGVSLLHSLFEFLAFSSEVSHWRKKDNMAGVSLGSILTNVVVQLIILLYLIDQSEQTSWMILTSQAVGIVIEAWKLTKAVTVAVLPRQKGQGSPYLRWLPYRLDIQDRHVLTEEERKTKEYDALAFRLVSWVAVPLLGAYTIYSALYQTHRGWWSFVIGTLCSFVYAFGFVSLVPQLIVNYKLKSTAGMNSKTFVYKILGTFVDDLFAFAIRQPWLHRLACFRDDIVFLVLLYQRWIYGVDPTRVNEFGQVLEPKKEIKTADDQTADGEDGEAKKVHADRDTAKETKKNK